MGNDGLPIMTGGNFAVVFKMRDEETGKVYIDGHRGEAKKIALPRDLVVWE